MMPPAVLRLFSASGPERLGRSSELKLASVVRPELQAYLQQQFAPGQSLVEQWFQRLEHQRRESQRFAA